jgi:ATP-dependent DNA helicase RecQ
LEIARTAGVPPFVIFLDVTLMEMATWRPHTLEAFATLHGVGRAKQKYAESFLPIIIDFCKERGLKEQPTPDSRRQRKEPQQPKDGSRTDRIVAAYEGGRSLAEIAAAEGIEQSKVLRILLDHAQAGHVVKRGVHKR